MSRPKTDQPGSFELTALRSYLLSQGFTAAQIGSAVGTAIAGRTRSQITDQLTRWLADRHRRVN